MPKFIKDFFDVYAYDNDRQFATFGNELKGRVPKLHPVTGKKIISVGKIISRVIGTTVFVYFVAMLIRYIIVWG